MGVRLASYGIIACSGLFALVLASDIIAQPAGIPFERLPPEQLAVTAPSARVTGEPGRMRIVAAGECPASPDAALRRRIVDITVQEWGYFGFNVVDQTADDGEDWGPPGGFWRRFSWLEPAEAARVAHSIAGYWAATPDGSWILSRQNAVWSGPQGIGARWQDPWSAAFISWVMCESGLGSVDRFRRHIAHHAYIDQAIEARDAPEPVAAFVAYDVGERSVGPGDMVCRVRRSAYRSIADRRPAIGDGVRSHCDIVVAVEADRGRILAIGGNVQGKVSLKLLPARFDRFEGEPVPTSIGQGRWAVFAHLKLRAPDIEANALASTPTLRALADREAQRLMLEHRLAGDAAASLGPIASGTLYDAVVSPSQ